jgi:hypothetical protein
MNPRRRVRRSAIRIRVFILIACITGLSLAALIETRRAAASVTITAAPIFLIAIDGPENVSVDCEPAPGKHVRVTVDGTTTVTATLCSAVTSLQVSASGNYDNTLSIANVNSGDFTSLTATAVNGGPGNDLIIGSPLNDTLDGGGGDDTFIGNGGTDNIGGGAGSSVGDSILVSGTTGNDTISLAMDLSGHLLATVNGVTTTYQSFIGGPIASSGVEHIIVQGLAGNDTLTVDSTNGAIPIPINFDGGDNTDSLILTGGTATSDIYTAGPLTDQGSSQLVIGGVTQSVSFTSVEPMTDLVAGPIVVNGTNANNAISYTQGSAATNGLVIIDDFETVEFSNKDSLTINGLGGDDVINLNNQSTPTALASINVNGGDPTASDTLIVNGRVNASDTFTYMPATTTSDTGSVADAGLPTVNFATIEHLFINGQNGGPGGGADSLTINTSNLSSGQTEILTPGAQFDSGHVDFRDRPGGFNPIAVPLDFSKLGVGSSLTFTDIGRFDNLIYNGTSLNDTFSVNAAGLVGLNTQIPVSTPSMSSITLAGLGGNDTFNVAGNDSVPVTVEGSASSANVLNFTGNGAGAVRADLAPHTVTEAGFAAVTFSGIATVNANAVGAAASGNDSTTADLLSVTPTASNAVTLTASSLGTAFNFSNVSTAASGFLINATGSGDQLFVQGTPAADTVDVNDAASGAHAVKVNAFLIVNYNASLAHLEVDALAGSDTINIAPSTTTSFTVDGGDPTVSPGDTINLIHPPGAYQIFAGVTRDSGALSTPGFQPVSWTHIESVPNTGGSVPVITGTNDDDQITVIARDSSYNPANPGVPNPLLDGVQDFTVSINNGPDMLFINTPNLFIDGLSGKNSIVVREPAPNQAVWNVQVFVANGPPAGGVDPGSSIELDTPGSQSVTYTPNNPLSSVPPVPGVVFSIPTTGGGQFNDATNTSTVNAVQFLIPLFNQSSAGGAANFIYGGEAGGDTLAYNTPANANVGSNLVLTPGATTDAGSITGNLIGGAALTPLTFSNLGNGQVSFTTSNVGRTDHLIYNGTPLNDTFAVTDTGVVTLNNQIPVNTASMISLTLAGQGGNDTYNVASNNNLPGGVIVQGGAPLTNVFNFTGDGTGAVTVDLTAQTITEAGFSPVSFTNFATTNVNAGGNTVTVTGTSGDETLTYTATGATTAVGALTTAGSNNVLNLSNFSGVLSANLSGGNNTVIVNGRVNTADIINYTPATSTSDSGSVAITSLPTVSFAGVAHLVINGQNGGPGGAGDALAINDSNLSSNQTEILTPAAAFDSGRVDFRDRPGGVNPIGVPVDFSNLGVAGSLSFTDSGRFDNLIYNGTPYDDTFSVNAGGQLGLNNRIPVNTPAMISVTLAGLNGANTFNIAGNHNLPGSPGIFIEGGGPLANVLNFNGNGAGAVTVDLSAQTVTETGFTSVAFTNCAIDNVNAGGASATVNGTNGPDNLSYTPTDTAAGTVTAAGLNTTFNISNITGTFTIDPLAGSDIVTVNGTAGNDTITALPSGANTMVQVNALQRVTLPNANTEALSINGGAGDDTLAVNATASTNPVAIPITYDGGTGVNALTLRGTTTGDTYTPGPQLGAGTNTLVFAGGTQVVNFLNLAPIFDFIAGPLVVNGTNGDDAINYKIGFNSLANFTAGITNPTWGEVTVGGYEAMEFINKTTLTINGLAGSDVINLNNQNTPTGLTAINVNGGDPTASDTLIVNGRVNATDAFTYTPATSTSDTGSVADAGLPTVNFATIEHLVINGQNGGPTGAGDDSLTISTSNLSSGQTEILTPGTQFDSGHIDFRDRPGGLNPTAVPLDFSKLGVAGTLSFADVGRFDNLIYNGTPLNDTFTVTAGGVVTLNNQIPVSTSSIIALTLAGLDGDDTFNVLGNHNFPGSGGPGMVIQGGDAGNDVVNFTASATVANLVTADFGASSIQEATFAPISVTGVEIANINANSHNLAVNGTSGGDNIIFAPTGDQAGTVTLSGNSQVTKFNLASNLTLNGMNGNDFFNITPSSTTAVNVFGGNPTPPASPGDSLNVNFAGTTGASQTNSSGPNGLAGSFTFTNRQTVNFQEIETLSPLTVTGKAFNAVEGVPFSNQIVGTFNAGAIAVSNFSATINWGDGTASTTGVAVANGAGAFNILGGHTYSEEGSYNVVVQVTDSTTGTTQQGTGTATVADAPLSIAPQPAGASTTFTGAGGTNLAGGAFNAMSAFQAAIGGANNGATPSPQNGGFRTINWDGVLLAANDGTFTNQVINAHTVGIPLNRFQERGMNFEEVYAVSDDGFTSVNPGVAGQFPAFSPAKTFAMFNDNSIDFNFVLPSVHGANVPIQGVTRGFGAIFLDVETANTTSIEYFSGTTSLGKFFVPVGASGQPQFFGVLFQNAVVTNVSITLGNATLFSFDGTNVTSGPADAPPGTDLAVTDDFVYPEPQAVATGINVNAVAGTPFTAKVASFTDADPNGQLSDYSVVIDWGDGTSSAGGVSPNAAQPDSETITNKDASITASVNGGWDVSGTHTYAGAGSFTITTSIRDIGGSSISASSTATVTGQPSLSINDVTQAEGNSGTTNFVFTVTQSAASPLTTTVNFATSNGTATAGSDYQPAAGTLTFAPGVTTQTITVPVIGDTQFEPDETFFVTLTGATNASIIKAVGTGTITNDDPAPATPSLSINDVQQFEGNSGTTSFVFTVTQSAASPLTTTVNFATLDGTATVGGSDYQPAAGMLTFAPGVTTQTITVLVNGDSVFEPDETFFVTLTGATNASITKGVGKGTITNDDPQPFAPATPALSINSIAVTEGNSGTTPAVFTVSLLSPSNQTVTVDYVTADGTATAPSDYDSQAGTLSFPPGTLTRTIDVAVKGDTTPEPNETFFVNLLNPVNGTINVAQGTGTINDDDESGFVQFSSPTATVTENGGSVSLTVTRTGDTSGVTTVNFETSDGTAVQKSDYTFNSGTVQFNPGDTSKTISVLIVDDVFVEGPENFKVTLSNVSGGFVISNPNQVTVTITDNDSVPPVTNPIDDPTFFVRQHYLDFLGRQPDAAGLNYWVGLLNACGANPACTAAARVNVSAAFFLSIEYQETSGAVVRMQRVAFGKFSADPALRVSYLQFMRDTRQIAAGVVVGQPGYDTLLEQNKQAYATQLVNSSGFLARFPIMPAAQYVDALIASTGLAVTAAERTAAINAFGIGGTLGRVAALRSISDSSTVRAAEMMPSFVLAEYFGYLRRNPTDPLDFNDVGYQFWLAKLNAFNGDFVKAEMVKAFINSGEYRQRFGP